MGYELRLPDLGEGLTEGEIARWLVAEGQEVAEDDPLVEIQTDKTIVEIPSPAAGTVTRILAAEGAVVPVGTVIVVIGDGTATPVAEAAAPAVAAAVAPPRVARVRATPLVRRLAVELGVDLTGVPGTGRSGQILARDVHAHVGTGERREKVRGTRRVIVEHLTTAHREVPAVTFVEECDFTGIDVRALVPLVLRAVAQALQEHPELNARLEGDEIVYLDRYDIGVAVQTEQGLVVPVVRDCANRSLEDLDAEVRRLADGARAGRLEPGELRDGTFTVTSAGKLGGLLVTPLVNHPEVAILGIHRIGPRPVVRDGGIHVRQVGNVSVTFDHRVIDGARAAAFCLDVIDRLQVA